MGIILTEEILDEIDKFVEDYTSSDNIDEMVYIGRDLVDIMMSSLEESEVLQSGQKMKLCEREGNTTRIPTMNGMTIMIGSNNHNCPRLKIIKKGKGSKRSNFASGSYNEIFMRNKCTPEDNIEPILDYKGKCDLSKQEMEMVKSFMKRNSDILWNNSGTNSTLSDKDLVRKIIDNEIKFAKGERL